MATDHGSAGTPAKSDATPVESNSGSNLDRLLLSAYSEVFSEEAKKDRSMLLIVSLLLLLVTLGAVEIGGEHNVPIINLSVNVIEGTRWILLALSGYFLLVHCARSYTEWKVWHVKLQSPGDSFGNALSQTAGRAHDDIRNTGASLVSWRKLTERLDELKQDPDTARKLDERRNVINRECSARSEALSKQKHTMSTLEYENEEAALANMREELLELGREIKAAREQRGASTADERDDITQRMNDALRDDPRTALERQRLTRELERAMDGLQSAIAVRKLRLALEVLFPAIFAGVAMLIAVSAP